MAKFAYARPAELEVSGQASSVDASIRPVRLQEPRGRGMVVDQAGQWEPGWRLSRQNQESKCSVGPWRLAGLLSPQLRTVPLRTLLRIRMLIARSWAVSWCLYRLHGIRLIGPPGEQVWYFAYGANMHDSSFRGWRGMSPVEWRPGRVHGYQLRFNLPGWPRGRAAPANLHAHPQADVWGVLYAISRHDLLRLDASEGVPWWRYRPLWIDAGTQRATDFGPRPTSRRVMR